MGNAQYFQQHITPGQKEQDKIIDVEETFKVVESQTNKLQKKEKKKEYQFTKGTLRMANDVHVTGLHELFTPAV